MTGYKLVPVDGGSVSFLDEQPEPSWHMQEVDYDPFAPIAAPPPEEPEPGYLEVAGKGVVQGLESMAGSVANMGEWTSELAGSETGTQIFKTAREYWEDAQKNGWAKPDEKIFGGGDFFDNPSVKRAWGLIWQAAPWLLGSLAVGGAGAAGARALGAGAGMAATAGGATAGTVLGTAEGSQSYIEARKAGKSVGEATGIGAASSAGIAVLEALPTGFFLRGLKGGIAKRALKGTFGEGLTESAQQFWQNLVNKIGYDKTQSLSEGLVDSFIGGAGVGAPAGIVFDRESVDSLVKDSNEKIDSARKAGLTDDEIKKARDILASEVDKLSTTLALPAPEERKALPPGQGFQLGGEYDQYSPEFAQQVNQAGQRLLPLDRSGELVGDKPRGFDLVPSSAILMEPVDPDTITFLDEEPNAGTLPTTGEATNTDGLERSGRGEGSKILLQLPPEAGGEAVGDLVEAVAPEVVVSDATEKATERTAGKAKEPWMMTRDEWMSGTTASAVDSFAPQWDEIKKRGGYKSKDGKQVAFLHKSTKKDGHTQATVFDNGGPVWDVQIPDGADHDSVMLEKGYIPLNYSKIVVTGGLGKPSENYGGFGWKPAAPLLTKVWYGPKEHAGWMVQRLESGGYNAEVKDIDVGDKIDKNEVANLHRGIVEKAISEGKQPPPEVLADYPDLAKPVAPAEPVVQTGKPEQPTSGRKPIEAAPQGQPGETAATKQPFGMSEDEFANYSKAKIVKRYGVTSGNRFARVQLPDGTIYDVKTRDGADGSEETRVKEIRRLLYNREANNESPKFKRGTPSPQGTVESVTRVADELKRPWKNAPETVVVQSQSELPDAILKKAKEGSANIIDGVFFGGKVYLVADNLGSEARVVDTLLHESFGHYGIRTLLGKEGARPLLRQVYMAKANEIRAIAEDYGIDLSKMDGKELGAEEWLAREAQKNPESTWVDRAVRMVKDWLRKLGVKVKLSDREIRAWLSDMRSVVVEGKGQGKAVMRYMDARFMVAHHGTPHVFAKEPGFPHGRFRLDKVGTGEGGAAYGWGIYFAEKRDLGEHYRELLTRDALPKGDVLVGDSLISLSEADAKSSIDAMVVKKLGEIASLSKSKSFGDSKSIGMALSGLANRIERYGRDYGDMSKFSKLVRDAINSAKIKADLTTTNDTVIFDVQDEYGSLYTIDIPKDVIPKLLDWDKPLSEQSEYVKKALRPAIEKISKRIDKNGPVNRARDRVVSGVGDGHDLYRQIEGVLGSQKSASEYLASIGIPGNTHGGVSQGATGAKYVIWDQSVLDRIALLERNGEKLDAIREEEEARFSQTKFQPVDTESKEFKRWFAGSKVVDENGKPLRVYHATFSDFSVFDEEMLGDLTSSNTDDTDALKMAKAGFWFADQDISMSMAANRVMPVFLSIKNPKVWRGNFWNLGKNISKIKRDGYDGIIVDDAEFGVRSFVAFSPTQIKSSISNTGQFSESNPDIRLSARKEGRSFEDTKGQLTEEDYEENRKNKKDVVGKTLRTLRQFKEEIAEGADKYLGNISTRLGNINERIKYKVRELDARISMTVTGYVKDVEPMLRKVASKMTANDKADWDLARKGSDVEKINELIEKYGIQKEYKKYREVLDKLKRDAYDVGLATGKIEEYAPRVLKDPKGFLRAIGKKEDWPFYSRLIDERAAELGIKAEELTLDQRANIISSAILGVPMGLGGPTATKHRKLEVVPGYLSQYYMSSDAALMHHIREMVNAIESRKFFGKIPEKVSKMRSRMNAAEAKIREYNKIINDVSLTEEEREAARKKRNNAIGRKKQYEAYLAKYAESRDYQENIASYIANLIANKEISPHNEKVLQEILKARFHERGSRGIVQTYKNLSYIDTMGSPISALTQIGDLAWAAYDGGFAKALKFAYKSAVGKSRITKEDIGIERIAQEFADASTLGKAVSLTFKLVGLDKMDSIGKESLMNTALDRYENLAKKDPKKLRSEIKNIFGEETEGVIQDLANGDITDNVKLLIYNKVADFQPIGLSEMTQKYLEAGNGRVFYMLKTFTLKQFDAFRRESYNKIRYGNKSEKIQGMKNLVRLGMIFTLANAGADELKDWILGRKTDLEDRVVDNVLRLFGVSKFVTWQARTDGIGSALARQILPPFKFVDSLGKDVMAAGDGKGLDVTASIPVIGKLYYWHMGRGTSKREELWDRRFSKKRAALKDIQEGYEAADNKFEYIKKHRKELVEYKRTGKLQGKLNKMRKIINKMKKSKNQTEELKARTEKLENARTEIIKKYFKEN